MNSKDFYELCIGHRLSPRDFELHNTTELKLQVLDGLMNIQTTAKMIGEYSSTNPLLYTEKLAGGVHACLGFVNNNGIYYPNTALKEDIRKVSASSCERVLAVFKKDIAEGIYTEHCYTAKGINIETIMLPECVNPTLDVR